MTDDVIVCRCEEVTLGEIRQAIREGAVDVHGVKLRTRAGMGLCQGRTCESLVARILMSELGIPRERVFPDRVRPPVISLTFGALAGGPK
ncbi:MAG: (2Fe-2S)-binding protein [Candidatus Bipolaricaulia bacterium]